ncbi:DUF3238 domain-containing protein [Aneurinibacillus thermoaerophilus]|uniref:DUF3238 domain-containing protein n=1 Tax=Aneurinibacillus thermoaerophilus TaxID=143495 RepID=UPI002E1F711E|nr:DUF3238 domain-containing protein [Aneurinibacillus thermoaerophilus]
MATKVIVRLATFIRAPWVHDPTDLPGGDYSEFQGDNRGFTPYTGASETYYKRYRTWQEFEIDFSTGSMTYREDMDQTVNRITKTDGTVTTKYGTAPLSGISFANVQWGQHSVQFDAIVDASNPLVTAAPALKEAGGKPPA